MEFKLDKTTFSVTSLTQPSDDRAYWNSKSPYERLLALEALRQLNYGYHQSPPRLQRIFEVVRLKTNKQTVKRYKGVGNGRDRSLQKMKPSSKTTH
ncbi:MAG: hypothetical protein A3A86_03960 [Elusimicrobia bacterium RIFCSPLOWO2_01_FULL_60_11]|nr:MAG: hypothetical protein A3A86_03960 [Elusimicrobia bacterium RIFCSPLOWO2_01_FULL_60_11]